MVVRVKASLVLMCTHRQRPCSAWLSIVNSPDNFSIRGISELSHLFLLLALSLVFQLLSRRHLGRQQILAVDPLFYLSQKPKEQKREVSFVGSINALPGLSAN